MKKIIFGIALICLIMICASFGTEAPIYSTVKTKKIATDTIPVKIELEQTSFMNMNILFITDTAITTPGIQIVLGKGYGEIMQFVQLHKLQPLKFMAKYHSYQPPWIMDIAVEVNELPVKFLDVSDHRYRQVVKC